jgi:hypothetical protein
MARIVLRGTLATLAHRARRGLLNAPVSVANYRCGEYSLTAVETIAHMGDLMDWALSMAEGQQKWHHSTPLAWDKECERFFAALKKLDDYLASEKPLQVSAQSYRRDP